MIKLSSQLIFGCLRPISSFVQLVQACPSIMRGQCTQRGAMERQQQFVCVYWTFLVHLFLEDWEIFLRV